MRKEFLENPFSPEGKAVVYATLEVSCRAKKHQIQIMRSGAIRFLDHGRWSIKALVNESKIMGYTRGCYALALVILEIRERNLGAYELRKRGKRRSSKLADLHHAGVPDLAGPILADMAARRDKRRGDQKGCDEYALPFHRAPGQRMNRIFLRIHHAQQAKLERVTSGLKSRGFDPLAGYVPMESGLG